MRLLILEKAARKVAAIDSGDGAGRNDCQVLRFLSQQPPNRRGSAKGFVALFRRYARLGRQGLTYDQFHLANTDQKIWEFRKGALRIFCFEDDDGALILLMHGAVKKTQKVPKADIAAAVESRRRYLSAKAADEITFEEMPRDDGQGH